ncbi:MAG: hypothetical protein H6581_24520 [Bacteroidia bacterium]|nr:hypothetical protein [Bacteroidia bacterium]
MNQIKYMLWLFWKQLRVVNLLESCFAILGIIWTLIEALTFFGSPELSTAIKSIWWLIFILGLIVAIYLNRPKSSFVFKVKNRDVSIIIQVGDIFKIKGSVIVPINHKLDCENNGIVQRSSSILKLFVNNAYKGNYPDLQRDIVQELTERKEKYKEAIESTDPVVYKMGTVVPVYRNEVQYYLLVNSSLNSANRSRTTEDDLRNSLNGLWSFLLQNGSKDNLVIPILGTGRGRISLPRQEVIKEIVLSFLVSLSSDSYCDQLIICIHPIDVVKFKIEVEELLAFIDLHCQNTGYKKITSDRVGTPLP